MPTNQNNSPFRVVYSGSIKKNIKRLHRKAAAKGVAAKFIEALRFIDEKLRSDPLNFGEPLYASEHLPGSPSWCQAAPCRRLGSSQG